MAQTRIEIADEDASLSYHCVPPREVSEDTDVDSKAMSYLFLVVES